MQSSDTADSVQVEVTDMTVSPPAVIATATYALSETDDLNSAVTSTIDLARKNKGQTIFEMVVKITT
ncbi:hypothetical protein [Terasakiella pusilla]|uniref:hypothetical protein n=1 Tax=Terasakiella pusilla TaxID=64973 RepID=UPI003AA7D6AD